MPNILKGWWRGEKTAEQTYKKNPALVSNWLLNLCQVYLLSAAEYRSYINVEDFVLNCASRCSSLHLTLHIPWCTSLPTINLGLDQKEHRIPWIHFIFQCDKRKRNSFLSKVPINQKFESWFYCCERCYWAPVLMNTKAQPDATPPTLGTVATGTGQCGFATTLDNYMVRPNPPNPHLEITGKNKHNYSFKNLAPWRASDFSPFVKTTFSPTVICRWWWLEITEHQEWCVGRTNVEVPLRIQISLICQAALHDVQAVVLTGFSRWHALTKGAVHHLGQSSDTRWRAADLRRFKCDNKHEQLSLPLFI